VWVFPCISLAEIQSLSRSYIPEQKGIHGGGSAQLEPKTSLQITPLEALLILIRSVAFLVYE